MADWNTCYLWMMGDEDAAGKHAIVPDKCPKGCALTQCFAISGVNSGAWPAQYQIIANTAQADRGPIVKAFYSSYFWSNAPNGGSWYAQLTSDDLCKRVFDFAVNAGREAAVETLQRAVLQCDPSAALDVDGKWGPHTIMRVNLEDTAKMVTAFCAHRLDYYKAIVAANPADAVYLPVWTARALK
jgi:hypothetical protein